MSNCSSFQYYSMMSRIITNQNDGTEGFLLVFGVIILKDFLGGRWISGEGKIRHILTFFDNLILLWMSAEIQQNVSLQGDVGNKYTTKMTQEDSGSLIFQKNSLVRSASNIQKKSFSYAHIPMPKETPHWNHSSATLRHTSTNFRFAKSARFPEKRSNYQDSQQLEYPSSLASRPRSLGFGQRVSIPEAFSSGKYKVSENCPFYELDKEQLQRSNSAVILGRGKTFGIGWRHYEASRAPHRPTVHSSLQQKYNPAPNHYILNPEGTNESPKIQMHKRLEMFTNKNGSYRRNEPHPQSYEINEKLVRREKSGVGFGIGKKTDFTKLREQTPGPIYKEKNICDKFIHLKLKLNQL